jgi:hypothetical protein
MINLYINIICPLDHTDLDARTRLIDPVGRCKVFSPSAYIPVRPKIDPFSSPDTVFTVLTVLPVLVWLRRSVFPVCLVSRKRRYGIRSRERAQDVGALWSENGLEIEIWKT